MSRFAVSVSNFERTSLSDAQIDGLFGTLEKQLPLLEIIANKIIQYMKENGLEYRLITLEDNYVITVRKNQQNKTCLCIGYPFPITSKTLSCGIHRGFQVSFYIRGKKLRDAQREFLIQRLQHNTNFSIKMYRTRRGLRHALSKQIKELHPNKLCYFNFYRFIGDSFLGTYMLDAFAKEFKISNVILLSNNHEKLAGFYDAHGLDKWSKVPSGGIYVLSDLLDIDDAMVQGFVTNQAKDGLYILNSRNAFIVRNGHSVQYYGIKNEPDVLLTSGNVFPYMQKCISAFVRTKLHVPKTPILTKQIKSIYVNPFSSLTERCLSLQELKYLTKELRTSFDNIRIVIPYGYNQKTKRISAQIAKTLKLERFQDSGFYDLIKYLRKIDLIITPDTALNHIATKCNIPNIVVFKSGFWDPLSIQSLAAESPLSFCSTTPCQLPIVLHGDHKQDCQRISSIIQIIQGKSRKVIDLPYNFCQAYFSLGQNLRLARWSRLLSAKHKLKYYKRSK